MLAFIGGKIAHIFRSWYGMAEQNIEEREKMLP